MTTTTASAQPVSSRRADRAPRPPVKQQQQDADHADRAGHGIERAPRLNPAVGIERHGEIVARANREAEDAAAGVLFLQRPAIPVATFEPFEALVLAFPQQFAPPAQPAAGEFGGEAVHHEVRQPELPAAEDRERPAVALQPFDVALAADEIRATGR